MECRETSASRTVHCAEAVSWLEAWSVPRATAFITSLPDVSETSFSLHDWTRWFRGTAGLILSLCPEDGVAIFYQTDIKVDGVWVDKGHLCQLASDDTEIPLLWHKIACRKPPGTLSFGRPAYSHIQCFSPRVRAVPGRASPDVLATTGRMTWSRAMGVDAAFLACRFVLEHTGCHTVVDPFCGHGTVLAVANALGLNALGVDLSPKRCRKARALTIERPG